MNAAFSPLFFHLEKLQVFILGCVNWELFIQKTKEKECSRKKYQINFYF